MIPFDHVHPEVAAEEYRIVNVNDPNSFARKYVLREVYCPRPSCDCRRVTLSVSDVESSHVMATISFGLYEDTPLRGPFLDPLNVQSQSAQHFLAIVREQLNDHRYVDRLRRHYDIFKHAIEREAAAPTTEAPLQARESTVASNNAAA